MRPIYLKALFIVVTTIIALGALMVSYGATTYEAILWGGVVFAFSGAAAIVAGEELLKRS